MTTRAVRRQRMMGVSAFYWLVVGAAVVLLAVLAFTAYNRAALSAQLQDLAATSIPGAVSWMEEASKPITYGIWGLMALAVLGLVFVASRTPVLGWMARWRLIESARRHDVTHGLILAAAMAALAAFTWIYLSPIPVIPGAVHLRLFAFVPGVVALVFGRGSGFLTGYFASILWAWQAGYWILEHTPLVDGVFVGLFTGWFVAVMLRGNRSRAELLAEIEADRPRWLVKAALVSLAGGLVMAFFVGASLNITTDGAVPWWAGFFTIGVLSDTLPMVIWIPLLTEPLLRLTTRHSHLPNL